MAERRSAPAGMEPTPGILDEAERLAVQAVFGVDADQVARDHVISHALAAIADVGLEHVIFFGGTALSRTHLPETRLSEDIDLIAVGDRREVAARLERALSRRLGRLFGAVAFTPALRDSRHPHAAVMSVGDVRVQVQLLSAIGYPSWPTEERAIRQRYSDAPPARLRVLTAPSFAAAKLSAWCDRGAARDLYDLWALAGASKIDAEAIALFQRWGPASSASSISFVELPTSTEWERSLGHQCVVKVAPHEAAAVVAAAVEDAARALEV